METTVMGYIGFRVQGLKNIMLNENPRVRFLSKFRSWSSASQAAILAMCSCIMCKAGQ